MMETWSVSWWYIHNHNFSGGRMNNLCRWPSLMAMLGGVPGLQILKGWGTPNHPKFHDFCAETHGDLGIPPFAKRTTS